MVDFVLVATLLSLLMLGVLQLGLVLHVRNTLVAAAAEGARYAANADRSPADGVVRARQVITTALSSSFAEDVSAGLYSVDGMPTVYVQVQARLPLVGLLGPARRLVVRGHALAEAG